MVEAMRALARVMRTRVTPEPLIRKLRAVHALTDEDAAVLWRLGAATPCSRSRLLSPRDVLRTCAENPRGLRAGAYPGTLPILEAAGLVARRSSGPSGRS